MSAPIVSLEATRADVYSDADVAEALRRHAGGESYEAIARALGRPSGASVKSKLEREREKQARRAKGKPGEGRWRHCRAPDCGERFWSEHFGVRTCDGCRQARERAASVSTFEPTGLAGLPAAELPSFGRRR